MRSATTKNFGLARPISSNSQVIYANEIGYQAVDNQLQRDVGNKRYIPSSVQTLPSNYNPQPYQDPLPNRLRPLYSNKQVVTSQQVGVLASEGQNVVDINRLVGAQKYLNAGNVMAAEIALGRPLTDNELATNKIQIHTGNIHRQTSQELYEELKYTRFHPSDTSKFEKFISKLYEKGNKISIEQDPETKDIVVGYDDSGIDYSIPDEYFPATTKADDYFPATTVDTRSESLNIPGTVGHLQDKINRLISELGEVIIAKKHATTQEDKQYWKDAIKSIKQQQKDVMQELEQLSGSSSSSTSTRGDYGPPEGVRLQTGLGLKIKKLGKKKSKKLAFPK